jgi:uncharacterized Ntn-hydrolase superfamily protein
MTRLAWTFFLAGLAAANGTAQTQSHRPLRPVDTFSIVARDSATGEMGVAVESHWFAVGAEVTWGEAGVGVVATQSFIDPGYGPLGLDLLRAGKSADQALHALLVADPDVSARQVAIVDAQGRSACYTGSKAIPEAGCHVGGREAEGNGKTAKRVRTEALTGLAEMIFAGKGYSTQANLMAKDTVWGAMANAYETTKGDLTDRLIAALQAAQAAGGDIRGKQSAAILVVKGKSTGKPWADKVVDLRVDDAQDPIGELKRLVKYHRAYDHMENGDACSTKKDWKCAVKEYGEAEKLLPEQVEIVFWHAVTLVSSGQVEQSLPLFQRVFAMEPNYVELVGRLPAADLLPNDPQLIRKIQAQAQR